MRERGFSLVEMMVVVVVIGILIATAVPNLAKSNRTRQVEAAVDDMSARLQYARQHTTASRIPRRLVIDRGARSYRFEKLEDDSSWAPDPDEVYTLPPGVNWVCSAGPDSSNNYVEFESRGTVAQDGAPLEVLLSNAQRDTFHLSLVRTGRVAVHRGAH